MKKNKLNSHTKKKTVKAPENKDSETTEEVANPNPLDDEDQGFGGWLRSTDGIETMKLFVIANTIVMLTTIVYPHFKTAIEIISDMMYGPDSIY